MQRFPYHINGRTIHIKRVNWARFVDLLKAIHPPEIHKQLVRTLQGEKWVDNPHSPLSIAEKQRYIDEMQAARIRFYIVDGVEIKFTKKTEAEIDRKIEEIRFTLGNDDFKPDSRKVFYIEQILCDGPEQVAELIAAVTQLSHVDKEAAGLIARKFRTSKRRNQYFRDANLAREHFH